MKIKLLFAALCVSLTLQSCDGKALIRDVYWHSGEPVPMLPSLPLFFVKQQLAQEPIKSEQEHTTKKIKSSYSKIQKNSKKFHTCPLSGCIASYGSSTFFYWHLQNSHTPEERTQIAYICSTHTYATHRDATKRAHIRNYHKNLSKKSTPIAPTTEKPHNQSDDSFEILG